MAAATETLPMATLLGVAATGNILAAPSVMAASGAVWVGRAAVNLAAATRTATSSASPTRPAVRAAAGIRAWPTPAAVVRVVRAAAGMPVAAGIMANR